MSNIYYWEKLTFSKLVGKVNLSTENLKKFTSFESKKVQGIYGKCLFWHYCLELSLVYKTVSHISFNLLGRLKAFIRVP